LFYYNNLIAIRSEAKQTTMNQYVISQKQFRDGLIDVTELSRLKTIEVNSKADYEEAKRQFSIYYFQFEAMVGVKMNQLIKK
jgi:outer membrane protein TolC